jgi:hypothetical protein
VPDCKVDAVAALVANDALATLPNKKEAVRAKLLDIA